MLYFEILITIQLNIWLSTASDQHLRVTCSCSFPDVFFITCSSLGKELLKEIHVALHVDVGTKVIFEYQRCARILHVAVMKI